MSVYAVRYIRKMDRIKYVQGAPYANAMQWNTNATNADLVALVVYAARRARPFVTVPGFVTRGAAPETVHAFARDRVRYVLEDGDQLIRMPWRPVADGVADCKSMAVLCATLCAAAGCKTVLRFVRYRGEDHYAHVYAVADGVPVDPELPEGAEVPYEDCVDFAL